MPLAFGRGRHVSIHPPLCRRGERSASVLLFGIQKFQSTPRFVGEGNPWTIGATAARQVSIHPPLCRRGERSTSLASGTSKPFQSTPRFVGEGNT